MSFIEVKETFRIYKEKHVFLWSAFLTYLTVLNIVPFLYTAIFILSKIPFVKEKVPYIKSMLVKIIPAYSGQVSHYFDVFLKNLSGMELLNSVIFSLSMISLILGFMKAIRFILSSSRKFNFLKGAFFFILNLVAVAAIISIVVALKILIPYFVPHVANLIYVKILPFIIWFIMLFSLFYVSKPKEVKLKNVVVSAFFTTVNVFLLKLGMGAYFSLFSYNKIYGAVAIVPSVLLWLFLLWNVILFGTILERTLKI